MKSIKGTKTEKHLLTAFAGESQARNRYTYFASQAKKEGYEQIAASSWKPQITRKSTLSGYSSCLRVEKLRSLPASLPVCSETRRRISKLPLLGRTTNIQSCILNLPV